MSLSVLHMRPSFTSNNLLCEAINYSAVCDSLELLIIVSYFLCVFTAVERKVLDN